MRDLLGMPEWLAIVVWIVIVLAAMLAYGNYSIRKAHRSLAKRRLNPTREQFIDLLAPDVDDDVAGWLWDTTCPYYRPLTPHPEDHLIKDARIDDDDVTMDWLPAFAKSRQMNWKDWPDWPKDWELTVRNFARWLQLGVDALRPA
jgi:hypothetical protein